MLGYSLKDWDTHYFNPKRFPSRAALETDLAAKASCAPLDDYQTRRLMA